jgi:Type ISP C-terminal specificity domain/N-6 DNA Methylase
MDEDRIVRDYLARVAERAARGDAREESFYSSFEELLRRCGRLLGRRVDVTALPRKTAECLLDFQVWNGGRIAGYVEAKAPGTDLAAAAESPQLLRYRKTFPNLLLTDFREVRLFRGGALEAGAAIAPEGWPELSAVLDRFFTFGGAAGPARAEWIAQALAGRARILSACVLGLLREEQERGEVSRIGGLLLACREYLLADLPEPEFADLYAQTIAYGLLAARLREQERFDLATVTAGIPRGSGILRDVFEVVSLGALPPAIAWIVRDLVDLLAAAPVGRILDRHFDVSRKDPVQHFYETFLAAYDQGLRKRRGVYYTPRAVVSFMVRSVHALLRSRFGLPDGLADPGVVLLDPAAGTLTFLTDAFAVALDAYREAHGPGGLPALVRDHLLPHFHAFEVMMAPYAIGHWKARLFFEACGPPLGPLGEDDRVRLYLTNALEMDEMKQTSLPFAAALARESREAWRVKRETRVSVVIGNPPWSGHSKNASPRIDDLLAESYGRVDGGPLGERNPKWLKDDYVKFFRFGQRKIEENGEGILCLVTPHGYLDSPTFRGMRQSLLETFDELYFLDLHGNQRKRERCADGAADENVFTGVAQGVAIAILVKKPGLAKRVLAQEVLGSVARKERWLSQDVRGLPEVETAAWTEVRPRGPAFLIRAGAREDGDEEEYARGVPLPAIFASGSVGVLTARDAVTIGFDREDLERRVRRLQEELRKGGAPWRLDAGRIERVRRLLDGGAWREEVREILYRPFDRRVILYAEALVDRPRRKGMEPFLAGPPGLGINFGLVVPRQARERPAALVTDRMIAHKVVSAYDINSVFPLRRAGGLFGDSNLSRPLLRSLAESYGEEPSPEAVFSYIYAVLHSPQYRRKYASFLRAGFPRIPFPTDAGLFARLTALGAKLVDLHLLRSDRLREPRVRCVGDGTAALGRRRLWDPAERRVLLSDLNDAGLGFEGIEPEVWEHRIGGYQVLDRWLAARAGRRLTLREIEDFRRTVAALGFTLEVQFQIERAWGTGLFATTTTDLRTKP